jgi:hypothetical protein
VASAALTKSFELAKGLSSTVASMLPLIGATPALGTIFPFLNPKIIEDCWGVTLLAMAVAGLFTYFFSLSESQKPKWPGITSAILFFLSLILILILQGRVLSFDPNWQSLLARFYFVGLFVGIAGMIGWVLGRIFTLPTT